MSFGAALRAGLGYGALGFVIGGLLGPLREIVLAPRIGGVAAAWAEAAVMAPLLWLGAGWMLASAGRAAAGRGLWPPEAAPAPPPPARLGAGARLAMGIAALAVVLAAEAALGALLESLRFAAARAPRGVAELLPGWLLLAWLGLLPLLRRRA